MGQGLEIAIAGCGPAGMSAALRLRALGHRIRVFDQFEAVRPVGSGLMLQPTGLAVLEAMGLRAAMEARGQPNLGLDRRPSRGPLPLDQAVEGD